jgi:hypothetical protein
VLTCDLGLLLRIRGRGTSILFSVYVRDNVLDLLMGLGNYSSGFPANLDCAAYRGLEKRMQRRANLRKVPWLAYSGNAQDQTRQERDFEDCGTDADNGDSCDRRKQIAGAFAAFAEIRLVGFCRALQRDQSRGWLHDRLPASRSPIVGIHRLRSPVTSLYIRPH